MNDLMTKSFMSYVDLKKAAVRDVERDLEMGMTDQSEAIADPKMELFLEEAEKVQLEMASIKDTLSWLDGAIQESKLLPKTDALRSLRSRINAEIVTVLKKARAIKVQLEEMEGSRRLSESAKNNNCPVSVIRSRSCVTNGLRKKLKEVMMEFQDLRERMMKEHKETVGRCYYTVTGEHPDEETMEKIIASGVGEGEMLAEAIKEHGRPGKVAVLETLVDIRDRHDAAKEVERSLLELHQVFLDMAVMVEAQGEQMDNIEHHVLSAGNYVVDGTKELNAAKNYQKSSRKCMCLAISLLLIIILVVILPIVAHFTTS
ncbi:hypothetical protein Dimus_000503 [Dionaea muscipula]